MQAQDLPHTQTLTSHQRASSYYVEPRPLGVSCLLNHINALLRSVGGTVEKESSLPDTTETQPADSAGGRAVVTIGGTQEAAAVAPTAATPDTV